VKIAFDLLLVTWIRQFFPAIDQRKIGYCYEISIILFKKMFYLGSTPQISLPYSAMVLSELNFPPEATFMMAIFAHKSGFLKTNVILK